ncbi:hypothetical protein MACJ_000188 [Theileria orientalis]|uniref:peptidylprolyl isomerase n=1 Tax=Theileria orientalis TaxID=68886 RepID=A0A976M3M3_THEOR|nr:hypothetical protein MACJ_000188 [Theileria orientalis]
MVEIVELSSSEERSDSTVPPNNAHPDESNNHSESKVESSKSDPDATKLKTTEGGAGEVKDEDSPKVSSRSDKDASPKNSDEPVMDNSPVSSDDESSPGSFTVTANSLYHENNQGKELFVKGDYDAAIQRWSKSIENLTTILEKARNNPDHDITEEALHEFTKMYVMLCSNLALAHIKKENYEKSKEYCQYVLMYDGKSLKAHLRIVQADVKLRNFEQALKNCNKGLEFHPANQELLALRSRINADLKRYEDAEKLFFKNAFKKIEVDPRTEEVRPSASDDPHFPAPGQPRAHFNTLTHLSPGLWPGF